MGAKQHMDEHRSLARAGLAEFVPSRNGQGHGAEIAKQEARWWQLLERAELNMLREQLVVKGIVPDESMADHMCEQLPVAKVRALLEVSCREQASAGSLRLELETAAAAFQEAAAQDTDNATSAGDTGGTSSSAAPSAVPLSSSSSSSASSSSKPVRPPPSSTSPAVVPPPPLRVPNCALSRMRVVARALRDHFDLDEHIANAADPSMPAPAPGSVVAQQREADISRRVDQGFETLRALGEHHELLTLLDENGHFDPRFRPPCGSVQFAIGDVLQHKLFGRGVVYGWDEACAADDAWCEHNKIDERLEHGREQPFYMMLFADGTERYCSQENLSVDINAKPVPHEGLKLLFPAGFDAMSSQYAPSAELAARYPDDVQLRQAQQHGASTSSVSPAAAARADD